MRPEVQTARGGSSVSDTPEKVSSLTPKRLRFALLWAEADPDDSLQDIARRAGYGEGVAASGYVAELCRDRGVVEARDRRLADLQRASGVTSEDALVGLQAIARDPSVAARDRVAAYKTILAWYSATKGQQGQPRPGGGEGMADALAKALALQLGIPAEETT